jgi:hypothetical protein
MMPVFVYYLDSIVSELPYETIEWTAASNDQTLEFNLSPLRQEVIDEWNEKA